MTRLRGRSHIKIDDKGRLSLPVLFRDAIGKTRSLFVTNSVFQGHHFLDLYPKIEWEKLESSTAKLPSLKTEVQAFQRFYISGAEPCLLDSSSRLLIPPHLRVYAELTDDIVLVGVGHKIEIWSATKWTTLFGQLENDFERVINVISELEEKKWTHKEGSKR